MSFYDDASLVFLPSGEAGKDGKAYSMKPTDGSGDFTFSRGSNLTATRIDSNGLIEKGRENLLLQSNQFDTTWTTSNASVTSGQSGYDGSNDAWLLEKDNTGSFKSISQNLSISGVWTFSLYAKANTLDSLTLRNQTNGHSATFDLTNATISTNQTIDESIVSVGNNWYKCTATFSGSSSQVAIYVGYANSNAGSIYIQDAQLEIGLTATEPIESGATTGKAGILEDSPRFDYSGGASCPSLLLEPSRTNLVGYSEYFEDSSWGLVDTQSPTANDTTAPDGQETAYKIVPNTNNAIHYIFNTTISLNGQNTISVFAKYNGYNIGIRPQGIGSGQAFANFDLQNGTILGSGGTSYDDSSITSFGDGWYRISMTMDNASTYGINFYAVNGTTATELPSFTADGTSGYYLWGAQVEQASYISSYIPNHSGGSVTRAAETARGLFNGDSIFDRDWTAFCELVVPNVGGDLTGAGFVLKSVEGSTSTADRVAVLVHESNSQLELIFYDGTSQQQIPFNYTFGDTLKIAIRNDSAYFINGTKYTTTKVLQEPVEIAYGRAGQADSSVGETANIKQTLVFPSALSDANCITLTS